MSNVVVSRIGTDGRVVQAELAAPPHNFASLDLMIELGDALHAAAADGARAAVICSQGSSFCAGAQFGGGTGTRASGFGSFVAATQSPIGPFYEAAVRLFDVVIPMVAAVHGPAVGAGFGLTTACDLRVSCPEAFFATNFVKLGIHPGFGISLVLPELIGPARATDLLLTGRRVGGEEAYRLGIVDRLVARDDVRSTAVALADEIGANAPLGVQATRATIREGLAARVRTMLAHERATQDRLAKTSDAEEGIAAMLEKRTPNFTGA
jgi:enoyl-CoA hydratase/carnithine racemase